MAGAPSPALATAGLTATATAEAVAPALLPGPSIPAGRRYGSEAPGDRTRDPAAAAVAGEPLRHESVSVLTNSQRVRYWILAGVWAIATISFWSWWLRGSVRGNPWLYWPQTVGLFYQTTAMPTFFWFFVRKMRRPLELFPEPGLRVAMITLCVPSDESIEVIRGQLDALVAVEHPHDSWILDEGNSPEVRALAVARGVRYFTRRDIAGWNEPAPPFQRATKAGNVNAWLDHVGLDYDVFVQFDIDHRPRPDYLARVLGYLRDPEVAWIQAPSVCGNLDNWAARGLAEQELVFQGPLQMGFYGHSRTPFIVGSHTTYRTSAIAEIGGFQPTRAEDHLDTVVLAAHGYTGVYVPDTIATGDGPEDFATYLRQQFAWAYSMMQIALRHTPRLVRHYSPSQAFQFIMCQSWYALWSTSLAVLWALPVVALAVHQPISTGGVGRFLLYFAPVMLVSTVLWCEARRWYQPAGVRLSWRGIVLEIARWPTVLWALINVILGIKRPYMITPKGTHGRTHHRFATYLPYILLAVISLAAVWQSRLTAVDVHLHGYYGLGFLNAAIALFVIVATGLMEGRHLRRDWGLPRALRAMFGFLLVVLALSAGLVASVILLWGTMVHVAA